MAIEEHYGAGLTQSTSLRKTEDSGHTASQVARAYAASQVARAYADSQVSCQGIFIA